jgi:hypothetical protein
MITPNTFKKDWNAKTPDHHLYVGVVVEDKDESKKNNKKRSFNE